MKHSKRYLALVLGLSMTALSVVGCSSGSESSSSVGTTAATTAGSATVTEPAGKTIVDAGEVIEGRQFYTSDFVANGTDVDYYNNAMASLRQQFVDLWGERGELDKLEGYDEPIGVETILFYKSTTQDAYAAIGPKTGESVEQSRFIDAYKQLFNIDLSIKWLAPEADYDQKLRLDMAAGELPDVFLVKNQSDLIELAKNDLIWDLTDYMEQYSTETQRSVWNSDNGIALGKATLDGRIYGVPSKTSDTDFFSYLWIRTDWLEKAGLDEPINMAELEEIMEAFVNADFDGNGKKDTVGIVIDKNLDTTVRGIFNAYSAYPEVWVEKDGNLIWGAMDENNKGALSQLNDWYNKGYISKEFITQDNATAMEYVLSGHCGVVYGGHWLAHQFGDLHEMDSESNWKAVKLPNVNGKENEEIKSPLTANVPGWIAVNKNFEYPEIAVKMQNFNLTATTTEESGWWFYDEGVSWHANPTKSVTSAWSNLETYLNLRETFAAGDDTSLLRDKAVTYWGNLHGDLAWEWDLMFGPNDYTPMVQLEDAYNKDLLFYDAYYGINSDFMNDRWTTIKDEQKIAYTKMITGEVGVEEGFAQWLQTFNNLGGEQITQEVNEWYQNK